MATTNDDRNTSSIRRFVITICVVVSGFACAISFVRKQAQLHFLRQQAEWRQKSFVNVKSGNPRAWVMDSKLLPMLAGDADCRRIVTSLEFTARHLDTADVQSVSELKNVSSMMFYCTKGTKDLLLAARTLPVISEIYFEMPDLRPDDYLLLKEFPQLKKVRFEHVMEDKWIERLKSELPSVLIDAPFPRSKEPSMGQ